MTCMLPCAQLPALMKSARQNGMQAVWRPSSGVNIQPKNPAHTPDAVRCAVAENLGSSPAPEMRTMASPSASFSLPPAAEKRRRSVRAVVAASVLRSGVPTCGPGR